MFGVNSNFCNNTSVNGATQALSGPPPAQNLSQDASTTTTTTTTVSTTVLDEFPGRINAYPSMVTHQCAHLMRQTRRSAAAASSEPVVPTPAPVTTPVSIPPVTAPSTAETTMVPDTLPANDDDHPIFQPILDYAQRYASGEPISGYILTRRQEAEAVLVALASYEHLWSDLRSLPAGFLPFCLEEYFDDIERMRTVVIAIQAQLRREGSIDQIVFAEALEGRFRALLLEKRGNCLPREEARKMRFCMAAPTPVDPGVRMRYKTSVFLGNPPPASALPAAHATFLSHIYENNRNPLITEMLHARNEMVCPIRLGTGRNLNCQFVNIRISEQILSYFCRIPSALDSYNPSFSQFTQLSMAAQRRMIQQMKSAIEHGPLPTLEAALRDISGGITSYLNLSSSSYHFRRFVAENLLVQLIENVFSLEDFDQNGPDSAFYKTIGYKRLYTAIPQLRDLLNSLREQFRRDGLSKESLLIVETLDELLATSRDEKCKNKLQQRVNGLNHSTPVPPFTPPLTQDVPLYQGANFLHFVARCQRVVSKLQQSGLECMNEHDNQHNLLNNYIGVRSCHRILAYLNNVRNHPAPPPLADILPVPILPQIISSAPSTVASETTNATTTEPTPSPSATPAPISESSTTTLSTTEPESPPPSTTTTTTTTTTVRPRLAPTPAPTPRKTSREQTGENITLAELRRLNKQDLLRLFNAMKFSLVAGHGSHQKILSAAGQVVGVLPVHAKQDRISYTVGENILAAVKNAAKEKGGS